jgi:hypothetical protein
MSTSFEMIATLEALPRRIKQLLQTDDDDGDEVARRVTKRVSNASPRSDDSIYYNSKVQCCISYKSKVRGCIGH